MPPNVHVALKARSKIYSTEFKIMIRLRDYFYFRDEKFTFFQGLGFNMSYLNYSSIEAAPPVVVSHFWNIVFH